MYPQRVQLTLEYPVYFTRDVFAPGNRDFVDAVTRKEPGRRRRCCFVVEERVVELWPALLEQISRYIEAHERELELAAPPIVLRGGERVKNDEAALAALLARFDELRLDRHAAVAIIGGGALQDMAGYAAAITHRGVRVVRLPTTVLGQNDSGVGVKNGVNAYGKKNFLGTFAAPFAVIDDYEFLKTLPAREAIAGMAEALKVALIRDAQFFSWLVQNADRLAACEAAAVEPLVQRCAELHLAHIATSGDPFELGSARPLDFGHWAAHKLESMTGYELRHGEAVGIGIALDTRYSAAVGLLPEAVAEQVIALEERIGLPTWCSALEQVDATGRPRVLEGLAEFREHLGGELTITLLRDIGQGVEVHEMDSDAICASLRWLAERASTTGARGSASRAHVR